jgi:hypothetical protein
MTIKTVHTAQTAKHFFWIAQGYFFSVPEAFTADFRPLNPRTGKPWQAAHRITHGADVCPTGYEARPQAYSTLAKAQAALAEQQAKLAQRKPRCPLCAAGERHLSCG